MLTCTAKSRRAAHRLLHELIAKAEDRSQHARDATLASVIEQWLATGGPAGEAIRQVYAATFRLHVLPALDDVALRKLDVADLERWTARRDAPRAARQQYGASRLKALAGRDRTATWGPVTALQLRLLDDHTAAIAALDARERQASRELRRLVERAGSTLSGLCGIADRSDAEVLVETGDPRRFAGEAGFARFNGTAPLPVSCAEGDDQPKRHRLNRGGNRRLNAVLHRMAVTQRRCDPRARRIYDDDNFRLWYNIRYHCMEE